MENSKTKKNCQKLINKGGKIEKDEAKKGRKIPIVPMKMEEKPSKRFFGWETRI